MIKFVIELEDGNFARFDQHDSCDVHVIGGDYSTADLLDEHQAYKVFHEMLSDSADWNYHGKCVVPEAVRQVEIKLI